jgi:hypothetical protein
VVQVLNFGSELDIYSLCGAKPRTEQLPSSPHLLPKALGVTGVSPVVDSSAPADE